MHSVKVITFIAILLAIIIGAGIFTTTTLSTASDKLEKQIAQIEKNTLDDKWDEAAFFTASIENDWSRTQKTWAKLIDHIEIDNIDDALCRLSMYIQTKNKSLALVEAAALKKLIRHIPEKEALQWKNLF